MLYAISRGRELHELDPGELREFSDEIGDDVSDALDLGAALSAKGTIGGTAPHRVAEALTAARQYLEQ